MGLEEVAEVNNESMEAKTVTQVCESDTIVHGGQYDCKKMEDKIVTRSPTARGSLSKGAG